MYLSAHESKSCPRFREKSPAMVDGCIFDLALAPWIRGAKDIRLRGAGKIVRGEINALDQLQSFTISNGRIV